MANSVHFIGIGGIGVSALAQVAQARNARVSGSDSSSDAESNPALARLVAAGATFSRNHRAENVLPDTTLVVSTAAVHEDNPEIMAARSLGIRVISRAGYLGELMAQHEGIKIAVSGTHGKTTTTGMLGVMLQEAGLDPTVFVGGEVSQLGGNVRVGSPRGPFIAEACEAYDSFNCLDPDVAVVTNVEADHLDHFGTEAGVFAAFKRFLERLAPDGSIVACADDKGVQELFRSLRPDLRARAITYGSESGDTDIQARSLIPGPCMGFVMTGSRVGIDAKVRLAVPGRHNVENALAAAGVGMVLGLTIEQICGGLAAFRGVARRQELLGTYEMDGGSASVFDDYAHHPTEIRATLNALRGAHPGRRLVAVFQPHLYSRTRDFLGGFARSLSNADALIVTDVYAAREAPIEGVSVSEIVTLATAARQGLDARYVADRHAIPADLVKSSRPGDLIVFMGAGDIREQGEALVKLSVTRKAAV